MPDAQWARLESEQNCQLRRGAWYRVANLTAREVLLDVNRRWVPVPRASLRIVSTAPRSWSIVSRPPDAKGLSATWGDKYAVCPICRNRAPLNGAPHSMQCRRCRQTYRVAWEEWLIGRT